MPGLILGRGVCKAMPNLLPTMNQGRGSQKQSQSGSMPTAEERAAAL